MEKAIAEIIRDRVHDPRVGGMVSVMKVDTAKDLKTARVYVSVYGKDEDPQETLEGLKKCSGFIRRELAHDFKDLRIVPELHFYLDESMAYSEKISSIIEEIKHNDNH